MLLDKPLVSSNTLDGSAAQTSAFDASSKAKKPSLLPISKDKRQQVLADDSRPPIDAEEPMEQFEATKSRMASKTQEKVRQTIVTIDKLLELKKHRELEQQDLAFGASELYELAEADTEQTQRARTIEGPLGVKPE
jgi:hypothetical protein